MAVSLLNPPGVPSSFLFFFLLFFYREEVDCVTSGKVTCNSFFVLSLNMKFPWLTCFFFFFFSGLSSRNHWWKLLANTVNTSVFLQRPGLWVSELPYIEKSLDLDKISKTFIVLVLRFQFQDRVHVSPAIPIYGTLLVTGSYNTHRENGFKGKKDFSH